MTGTSRSCVDELRDKIVSDFVGVDQTVDRRGIISLCASASSARDSRAVLIMAPPGVNTSHDSTLSRKSTTAIRSGSPESAARTPFFRRAWRLIKINNDPVGVSFSLFFGFLRRGNSHTFPQTQRKSIVN